MNEPSTRIVKVNGSGCRIWENGDGEPLVLLSGFGGYPNWTPFLGHLASKRRLIVPSLPGYPGADGHRLLDNQLDWVSATLDLLEAAEINNTDLIGLGPGAAVMVRKLCDDAALRSGAPRATLVERTKQLPVQ